MTSTNNDAAATMGLGLAFIAVIALVALALYVFTCYCYKRICQKAGHEPGILIWIPIAHFIPLLQTAGMSEWMIILLFIPFVNLIVFVMLFAKLCTARGKSPWLVLMLFVPVVNLFFVPYLAFSE